MRLVCDNGLDSITDSMNMNRSKLEETVEDRGARRAAVHGVAKSRSDLVTEQQQRCNTAHGWTGARLQARPPQQLYVRWRWKSGLCLPWGQEGLGLPLGAGDILLLELHGCLFPSLVLKLFKKTRSSTR